MVICPKCGAHNPPDRTHCAQCQADLLPGRSVRTRIGFLVAGMLGVGLFSGLAWAFVRLEMAEDLPECCASPAYLVLLAFGCLVGGLRLGLGRTPLHERLASRAERHAQVDPEQALADLTQALACAPKAAQADLLKQRGELYEQLGRRQDALADLTAYAASPRAQRGAAIVSEIVGVELEDAAKALSPTEQRIQALQRRLTDEGALAAIGYCKRCKDAVPLDGDGRCTHCGKRVTEPAFVRSEESEAEMAKLRTARAQSRKRRRTWLIVGASVLFACALCAGASVWSSRQKEAREEAAPSAGQPTSGLAASTPRPQLAATERRAPSAIPSPSPSATPRARPSATPTPAPTSTPFPNAVVQIEALNVRAGPDTAYDKVGLLVAGDTVTVTGRTTASDWLAVTVAGGVRGWVYADYVELDQPVDGIPLVDEVPPTPTPSGPTATPLPPVDAAIARIARGEHGELPQPSEVGSAPTGGEAEVTIVNDTPYELTIWVGAPSSRAITVEPCATCKTYSIIGPIFCPREGRPEVTVRLAPGSSAVAAEVSDPTVIPFLGTWALEGDKRYAFCFYIVTRIR